MGKPGVGRTEAFAPTEFARSAYGRGVGEIGEAPSVAEEASRFRGSAPIGGYDSGRQSVGTTVGCMGCGGVEM